MSGKSPLMACRYEGTLDVVTFLCLFGADINGKDDKRHNFIIFDNR